MEGQTKQRIQSIDIVRGIIIIIMTLDHVRDFLYIHAKDVRPLNIDPPYTSLFFTRWITHFCAPTFVFLSGVSAWLAGQRRTKKEMSIFLIKRGLWLILTDLILITFAFSLDPSYNLLILEVLAAIGTGMIILGLLINTSATVIAVVGFVIFAGHNLLDGVQLPDNGFGTAVKALVSGVATIIPFGNSGKSLFVIYSPVSWAGVLLLGYVTGQLYKQAKFTAAQRQKFLITAGLITVGLFVVVRFINIYGDPSPWAVQKNGWATLLSFINTSKYPPSLLFCCMTLGPILILLGLTEKAQGKLAGFFTVYGKVPYFYFVVHFCIIRLTDVILFFIEGYGWQDRAAPKDPFLFHPDHFGFRLGIVYLLWFALFLGMYYPARWFNKYRATHKYWWLKYT